MRRNKFITETELSDIIESMQRGVILAVGALSVEEILCCEYNENPSSLIFRAVTECTIIQHKYLLNNSDYYMTWADARLQQLNILEKLKYNLIVIMKLIVVNRAAYDFERTYLARFFMNDIEIALPTLKTLV